MIGDLLLFLCRDKTIGPTDRDDITPRSIDGVESFIWRHADTPPTQQQLDDAANNITVINGQTFSQWKAENGGDPVLTQKRSAREFLDSVPDATVELLVAFADVIREEINALRAQHGLPARSMTQLKTAIKNKLGG